MVRNYFFLFFLLIINIFGHEVILTPPEINKNSIAQEIVCFRPMREGKFNISTEIFQENGKAKLIVHVYGHGGSGWTTLFGSVNKAIELFEKTNPNKGKPIHIIGSGCMGLTSAIELSRRGYTINAITTKEQYDIPSWRAAGYFALVSVKTSPEEQANLDAIGIDTFKTYQAIENGTHAYISKDAVKYMPVYCSKDVDAGVEGLEAQGLIPKREFVTLNFGNSVIHKDYVKYMTYFMNTTVLMRELWNKVKSLNINVINKEIKSFNEINEDVIFNCSGMGGRELNNDNNMISVRGHLLMLNENSGTEHMNYMIYTKVKQDDHYEYIYMFPKNISVTPDNIDGLNCHATLGGTFLPNTDKLSKEEQDKLDRVEFNKLLDRNSIFFHGVPFSVN